VNPIERWSGTTLFAKVPRLPRVRGPDPADELRGTFGPADFKRLPRDQQEALQLQRTVPIGSIYGSPRYGSKTHRRKVAVDRKTGSER
jgi:hypothetical protein